jgi:hypothetical protein
MDGNWLVRMRWRRRGAWLWPALAVATILDAAIGHALPPIGESQTVAGAAIVALVLNLLGVLLLSRPGGALLRTRRKDLPPVVARNYAGTFVVAAIAATIALTGMLHHSTVMAHRRALEDAIVRAQAWIGDHAPSEFRRNVTYVSTFVIEPGSVYRTCVLSFDRRRTYCVVVKTNLPFERSVSFAGYEPNSDLSAGTG